MLTDPTACASSDSPYDLLADAGVHPCSSMKEILDASFLLMARRQWSPEVRKAWDELRVVERRLVVDFLRYDDGDLDDGDVNGSDVNGSDVNGSGDGPPPPVPGADVVEFDR